jgi:tetratricopeptide (TPR) repeat protein
MKIEKRLITGIAILQVIVLIFSGYCFIVSESRYKLYEQSMKAWEEAGRNYQARTAEEDFNLGLVYGKQGNLLQAISEYTKAIAINPNYAEAYNNRGIVYGQQNKLTQALADFTKAIKINPNFAQAYYSRAVTYCAIKEYDLAWTDVHKAEELGYKANPQFLEVLKKNSGQEN